MQAAQYKCQHSCEHSHLRVSFMALWNLRLRVMPHFHFTLSQILKVSHLGVHRCPQTSRSITRSQSACINLLGLQAKVASNTKANGERLLSKIADHSSLISWISWVNIFLDREEMPCVWKTLNKNLSWMNSQKIQEHLSALSISQHLPTSSLHRSALHSSSQPRVVIVTGTAWSLKTRSAKMGCRGCGFSKRLRGSEWRRQKIRKSCQIDPNWSNFELSLFEHVGQCHQNACRMLPMMLVRTLSEASTNRKLTL